MTSNSNKSANSTLSVALEEVQQLLAQFASSEGALERLTLAFGEGFALDAAQSWLAAWANGDFSLIPEIEVVSTQDLGGANGGYAAAKNRIYVAGEFVETQPLQKVINLLLEEIGHKIDSDINRLDTAGDEGAIFARLVLKEGLSSEVLARLRAEKDTAVVIINGESVAIEQQNFTGTAGNDVINGTEQDDNISGFAGDDRLNGLGGNDVINGGDGRDTVDGGAGNDTLNLGLGSNENATGGEGDDLLIVDYSVGDTGTGIFSSIASQTEGFSGGFGRYQATSSYVLDTVSFNGINRFNITGTSKNDKITTGSGNDTINAGGGDDTIDGGGGIDNLEGGAGNDRLTLNLSAQTANLNISNAFAIDLPGVITASNFEIFNLTTGSGNDTINIPGIVNSTVARYGDTVDAGAGNDTLNLGLGANNHATGGEGDDLLIVDYSVGDTGTGIFSSIASQTEGFSGGFGRYQATSSYVLDTVSFNGINRFNITGTSKNDKITTGSGNDTINAGGGDDTIDGGGGIDNLEGGAGNDRLTLNLSAQTANLNISNAFAIDLPGVITASNFEIFNLTTGSGNDTINIPGIVNSTVARYGDTVDAGAGNDTLNLGLGANNHATGGEGDDLLIVDYSVGDTGTGIFSSIASQTEGFSGGFGRYQATSSYVLDTVSFNGINRFNITGTSKNDKITTGSGNDTINAGGGDDTIDGGGGIDNLEGGAGNDRLTLNLSAQTANLNISNAFAIDLPGVITASNFEIFNLTTGSGNDTINIPGIVNSTVARYGDTVDAGAGNDTLNLGLGANNYATGGTGDDLLIVDYSIGDTGRGIISSISNQTEGYSGGFSRQQATSSYVLDSISFSGINRFNITGTSQKDRISTGSGNDTIIAGAGDDTVDAGGGADTVDGGAGADTLVGGTGNDTYIIDATDTITEAANAGIDTIRAGFTYNLNNVANIENLTLTGAANINGTGTAVNNVIIGNSGINILDGRAGNDILNGGAGRDRMIGGSGNDLYYVDNVGDVVVETSNLGTEIDRVASRISYTLGANLEALYLQGGGAINGTGNALNNTIVGNRASNIINGRGGRDTMIGGLGNDLYYVDNVGDVVTETSTLASEFDRVASFITYNLSDNVEGLFLQGNAALKGGGNALNNTIVGNSGNNALNGQGGDDYIIGGLGKDILVGGAGADKFAFRSRFEGTDAIYDFFTVDDTILVSSAGFGGGLAANTTLAASQFVLGTSAQDAGDRFIYNSATGGLFFDIDGTGAAGQIQIAILTNKPTLTNADIFISA